MTTINLKDFYSWHTHDEYIEVSDEVAAELRADKLYEAAYQRRIIRNKAQYSLDCDDGIEYSACLSEPTPQELLEPDVAQALTDALAPLHLSALPLRGAWWPGTHFSASLFACLEGALPDGPLEAHVLLETEAGETLARFDAPCAAPGGALGTLEARLPDAPCVLTLTTQLLCGEAVLEENTLPVYVGERGVLEAAFGGAFQE